MYGASGRSSSGFRLWSRSRTCVMPTVLGRWTGPGVLGKKVELGPSRAISADAMVGSVQSTAAGGIKPPVPPGLPAGRSTEEGGHRLALHLRRRLEPHHLQ